MLIWNTKPGKVLRVRHALARTYELHDKRVSWRGDTVTVSGTVDNLQVYTDISRRIAAIVGAGNVVNATKLAYPADTASKSDKLTGSVTIRVNTDYDDSDESISQVKAIVQLPQFELYSVPSDQTLSSIILNRYRFGMTDLPRTFEIVLQRIEDLNHIVNPDAITGGPLKLPILPPRVQALPPPSTPTHSGLGDYSIVNPLTGITVAEPGSSVSPSVPSIRAVRDPNFILSVPVTSANALSTRASLGAFPAQAKSAEMVVTLAGEQISPAAGLHKTLTTDDAASLNSTLQMSPRRKATVFILDDAWPDAETYARSVEEIQLISNTIRDQYGMPRLDLKSSPFVPVTTAVTHSSHIRDSLKEFTSADQKGLVTVVYIPLSKAQNSSVILGELLRLYFMLKMFQPGNALNDTVAAAAEKWVSDVLTNIQGEYNDQKISSDWAIIESIWSLGDFMAFRSSGRNVFFINESWTVLPNTVNATHPGISAGVVVAAAGNTLGREVNSDIGALDFAGQCTATRSVIAALNVSPKYGIVCNSSIVKAESLDDTFVSAYDGEVSGGPDERQCLEGDVSQCVCGNSFSAPRIAWMLALSEAVRAKDLDYSSWNVVLENKLRSVRTQESVPWVGEYLHLSQLMRAN